MISRFRASGRRNGVLGVRPSNRRDNPDFSCCAFPMPIANLGDGRNGPR
jgi:hypothetical protein